MSGSGLLVVVLCLCLLPRQAFGALSDVWEQKHRGIQHVYRTGMDDNGRTQSYHIAIVDLTDPAVSVRTVLNNDAWEGAKEAVSSMARRHGAALAVNGDYWSWGTYDPSQGTTAVEGMCYRAHPERSAIAFSADLARVEIGRWGTWPIADPPPDDCEPWMYNAMGAGPQFIFDGAGVWNESANPNDGSMVDINDDTWFGAEAWAWDTAADPNTAVGVSEDGATLVLVTCDGRGAGGADGCRMASDMVDIMLEFGVYNALKLDSGGSTTFFYDGLVQNMPSGGAERSVADSLVVLSDRLPCTMALDGGTTVIDNTSPCFELSGVWWWLLPSGHEGSSWFTYGTDAVAEDCVGAWSFGVARPGTYRVEIFVPDEDGLSRSAPCFLDTGAAEVPSVLDQQASRGAWVDLGVHELTSDGSMRLADNTGEPYGEGDDRKVIFDAVRFTWQGGDAPDGGAGWDGGSGEGDSAVMADGGGTDRSSGNGGCSCRVGSGKSGFGSLVLLLLSLLSAILPAARPARRRKCGESGRAIT